MTTYINSTYIPFPITSGQVTFGKSGFLPQASTITAGAGITVTNGLGSITVASSATPLTNGQLLVGSTSNPPVATTLTAGDGVQITNGPGSISIASAIPWQSSMGGPLLPFVGLFAPTMVSFTFPT